MTMSNATSTAAMDLNGRVVLVTGASKGIGRAVAARLAEAGAHVALGYRTNREEAEQLSKELVGAGHRAVPVGGDVADPAALDRLVEEAEGALGPIDILISNAGTGRQHTLAELTVQTWDATMHEHLRAAFLLSQRLTPGMRDRRWGRVVLVSSVAAFTGGIVGPHYAAAKAGLIGLMHSLAASLAPHGVTVNVVAPALIAGTGYLQSADDDAGRELARRVPVGRLGQVEEVADLVLAMARNPYLTAQTVLIDGGIYPH
jgi:3-oxoacyl-[acyl-carrier protein] reductase